MRSLTFFGLGSMGSFALFALACGASTNEAELVAACDELVTAQCTKTNECFPRVVIGTYEDVNECIARQKQKCVKSFGAPSTGYTAQYATACAAAYRSATCDGIRTTPDACKTPAGGLPDDAPCAEDAQCAGRICNVEKGKACGYCAKRRQVPDGGLCVYTSDCVDGSVCWVGKCFAGTKAGGACSAVDVTLGPCAEGLVCSKGVCGIGGAIGDPCGSGEVCDPTARLLCSGSTCAAITLGQPGDACGSLRGSCAASGTCPGGEDHQVNHCLPAAKEGESCLQENEASSDGKHCKPPAACIAGTCTIVDPSTCK